MPPPLNSCYNSNINIETVVNNWMNMLLSISDPCIPHYEAKCWKQNKENNNNESVHKFKEMRNQVVFAIRDSKLKIKHGTLNIFPPLKSDLRNGYPYKKNSCQS